MKFSPVLIRVAAAVAALLPAAVVFGQGQNIAVIDINKIFKNDARLKAQMEQWKQEVMGADNTFKAEAKQINDMVEQLNGIRSQDPSYHTLESNIAKARADFEVNKQLKRKDLNEKETKILYTTYREVQDSVTIVARQFNIAVVFPYDSTPVDDTDVQAMTRAMQHNMVYVNPQLLDITDRVMTDLNRSANVTPVGQQSVPH